MKRVRLGVAACLMMLGVSGAASAQDPEGMTDGMTMEMGGGGMHLRPDGRAPIGVMGDHVPMEGAWSITYQFMRMAMDDNRSGTDTLSDAEVLTDFSIAPTRMTMDMHMASVMYGWSESLSFMAMVPYYDKEMDHINRAGVRFTTKSKGVGDVALKGVYGLYQRQDHNVLLNAGVSLPTGSIDKKDDTPAGLNQQLPYPMQIGSGTFDLLPGLTYRGHTSDFSWGGQIGATIRLGRNDNSYALGNRYRTTTWGARKWADWISTSLRVAAEVVDNVDGADPLLNPASVPTADPDRRGGTRVDILGGVNLIGTAGVARGQRLFIEFGIPIYQNLDGPQLETDWLLTVGLQFRF